jgi:hypothetical protein
LSNLPGTETGTSIRFFSIKAVQVLLHFIVSLKRLFLPSELFIVAQEGGLSLQF